ncbi:MAG: GGDEF domain-containing protein [Alphaproteobacteria bacterium]
MVAASMSLAARSLAIVPEGGPVAELAQDLLSALAAEDGGGTGAMVARVLDYAAAAERTMAAQRLRIAELETLSSSDVLTGLLNRRGLFDAYDRARGAAGPGGLRGVLCYLDVNAFKAVNDTHGHEAGDRALCRVADAIRSVMGGGDRAARLGGDEFAVMIADRPERPAGDLVSALLQALDQLSRTGEPAIKVSLGLAVFDGETTLDDVLAKADRAMYAAKRQSA